MKTIKSVGINGKRNNENGDSLLHTAVAIVVYNEDDGEDIIVELPLPDENNFIPLEEVTDEIIIGWIEQLQNGNNI
jgi:hypothetical protein